MASQKQVEANRRNAMLSTGPRTAAGKERARLNALKHGAFATQILTPDEHAEDRRAFDRLYLEHYSPRTQLDRHQVLSLAALGWRLRRYGRMDTEILTVHGYEPGETNAGCYYAGAGWGLTHDCTKARSLLILSQIEDRTYRQFRALKKDLDDRLGSPVRDRSGFDTQSGGPEKGCQ